LLKKGDSIVTRPLKEGVKTIVRGRVVDINGNPIKNASVDVWQTDANGLYDIQENSDIYGNMRGKFLTEDDGSYEFETVRPVAYPIPNDGPVGNFLRSVGRHEWRAAHIHAIVIAHGYI